MSRPRSSPAASSWSFRRGCSRASCGASSGATLSTTSRPWPCSSSSAACCSLRDGLRGVPLDRQRRPAASHADGNRHRGRRALHPRLPAPAAGHRPGHSELSPRGLRGGSRRASGEPAGGACPRLRARLSGDGRDGRCSACASGPLRAVRRLQRGGRLLRCGLCGHLELADWPVRPDADEYAGVDPEAYRRSMWPERESAAGGLV